ncbi:sugar ABC transporter substrate-binding protein [Streptomyces sp. NPDC091280]|uniref:sugar ABC transporter substrate-binding protein n=1 Tax=unclassified Streptomyces TaxID=2593676 RepID=UPI003816B52A
MNSTARRRAAGRRVHLTFGGITLAATVLLSACGSGSDSTTSTDLGKTATNAVAKEAETLVTSTMGKFSYSAGDFPVKPGQITPYTSWKGPTSAPKPAAKADLQVIACSKSATACMSSANGVVAAAKALGWTAEIIDGGGTPQGYSQAFDTAISRGPDAIIGIAVPTLAVGDKLAEARSKGIITVVNGDTRPKSGTLYDAYVSFRMPLMESLLAYAEIARTNGKADSIVVTDPSAPSLIEAMGQYKKVMATCSGCRTTDVSWKITDAADPTKVNSIVTGALAKDPTATSLVLPYSVGLPAAVQAVASAGKSDQVKILVKDADSTGLEALKSGQVLYNAGASPAWAGWATVDQVVRGMAKQPYLPGDRTGLGVVTFDRATVPAGTDIDKWSGMVDFASEYKKIWGVS